ncbi:site-specific DNA-methyltransferase [Candidatus Dojkabacteria bacterium]|nr:site-specific DNA-methyltransferase [Candidatus Dojkabacteria bacterium]
MNKINKQSLDLQEEKLKALQSAMPQLFNEDGVLDIKELELLSKNYPSLATGKYEFNWAGKISAKRNAYKPSRANLTPDKERSIEFESTDNMIIEGDNLEVLKLLQKSYSGKIKCIYIDPPYNTGNDFVYSDNYSEDKKAYWEKSGTTENGVKIDTNTETQGRYHSNWLNMMYPRLVLARELLKDDGVIFVSIDDNEVHNLRKITDEVFGEENFVAMLVWKKRVSPANDSKWFSSDHEYLLVYGKDKNSWYPQRLERTAKQNSYYSNPDNDPRGAWNSAAYTCNKNKNERPNLYYPIINPNTGEEIWPRETAVWAYSKETHQKHLEDNLLYWGSDGNSKSPRKKQFLSEAEKVVPRSFLDHSIAGSTQSATLDFLSIFNYNYFNYTKPVQLLSHLLKLSSDGKNDDIILDFFAGSGTTAHAVMELNKEDGGNRKYILVQLPELTDEKSEAYKAGYKTISDICIERVKRVSEKIKKEDEGKLLKDGKNLDLGFKVFKLAPSFFPENQFTPDPEKSEDENMKAFEEYLEKAKSQMKFEFEEEELLYEIALKDGFKLTFNKELIEEIKENKIWKISDGEKEALVCLDDTISNSTLKILEGMKDMRFICLERAVDTTKKWNLKSIFGQNLWVA